MQIDAILTLMYCNCSCSCYYLLCKIALIIMLYLISEQIWRQFLVPVDIEDVIIVNVLLWDICVWDLRYVGKISLLGFQPLVFRAIAQNATTRTLIALVSWNLVDSALPLLNWNQMELKQGPMDVCLQWIVKEEWFCK